MADGIIVINKEKGWTSHDVVAKLRGLFKTKHIGHAGTLDPMAEGVLPVFVGRATRAVQFAENAEKEYIACFKLGIVTDTQDITGNVIEEHSVNVTKPDVENALENFRGEIYQTPPMFSAIKKDGKKLYELARKGIEVEREARKINIYSLELIDACADEYKIKAVCSKGTYIRTLCHDIGQALKCGAVMTSLVRTKVGSYTIENSILISDVQTAACENKAESLLANIDSVFIKYPAFTVNAGQEKLCRCGTAFRCIGENGKYRVYAQNGEFLMLGEVKNGEMKTVKNFVPVQN